MSQKSFVTTFICLFLTLFVAGQNNDTIPWNGEQLNKHGITLFDNGKYTDALKYFNQVSKCDPEYATACYEAALTYENLGDYELGLIKVNEADSIEPDKVSTITLKGSLLDDLNRRDESIAILETARKKWPYNHNLLYNLAIVYVNVANYQKAEPILAECVKLSPYHSGTHILLGRINYIMGRMGESVLAYNMGLIMTPSSTNVSKFEKVITGEADPKPQAYRFAYPEGYNAEHWKELTRLCNSGIAFHKDFPYDAKPNYLLNRQSLLVFRKMDFKTEDTTIYNQFYVRYFKEVLNRNETNLLFGFQLQNINDAAVNSLNTANKQKTKKFVEYTQQIINKWREYGFSSINESNKVKTRLFNENGKTSMIGTQFVAKEPTNEGEFIRISTEGAIEEKGTFKNNLQEGLCTILLPDGTISQELHFTSGELDSINKTYYKNGSLSGIYPREKGKVTGTEIIYSKSGRVTRKQSFVDDKAEGLHYQQYLSSAWSVEQNYTNGKLNGTMTKKWSNGNLMEQGNYTDSLLNGSYKKWYSNGKTESVFSFKNDSLSGSYMLFHTNGLRKEEGTYNDSAQLNGFVTEFDRTGVKVNSKTHYQNGKLNGLMTEFYANGNIKAELLHTNDRLEKLTCYNPSGDAIYQVEAQNGVLPFKSFYDDGMLKREGILRDGKRDGEWRDYSGGGILISSENWKDGMESGVQKTFYPSGILKTEYSCDSNNIEGTYRNYFPNGILKSTAYYKKGLASGEYKVYHSNGTLQGHYYLNENDLAGRSFEYCSEGKLSTIIEYDENSDIKNAALFSNGKLEKYIPYDKDSSLVEFFYPNGKLKLRFKLVDGLKEGDSETYYPNGKIQSKYTYLHGKINGTSKYWDIDGNIESVFNYNLDKLDGHTYFYEKGKIISEDYYEEGKNQNAYRELYSNGKTYRLIRNIDDTREGEYELFSPDSVLLFSMNYQDELICSVKLRNKQGKLEKIAANEAKSGTLTSYYPNGAIAASIPLINGYFNGALVLYQANGNKIVEKNYVNDYLEGPCNEYHLNGKLKEASNYRNNDLDGKWVKYSETGVKLEEGNYSADNKIGVWIYYDAAGKEKYKVLYENNLIYDFQ